MKDGIRRTIVKYITAGVMLLAVPMLGACGGGQPVMNGITIRRE